LKGARDYVLPLGPQTLAMLKKRQATARSARLIFPGFRDPEIPAVLATSYKDQLPFDCGPHDARKMFGFILDHNAPHAVAKLLMTHADTGTLAQFYSGAKAHPWSELVKVARPGVLIAEDHLLTLVGNMRAIAEGQRLHVERRKRFMDYKRTLDMAWRAKARAVRDAQRGIRRA
jgi:hypothetical protein